MSDYDYNDDNEFLTRGQARQELSQALADIAKYNTEAAAGVQRAIDEVAKELPDFRRFVSEPQNVATLKSVLAEYPALASAIQTAEATPELQGKYLAQFYKMTYRLGQTQPPSYSRTEQTERPESPRPGNLSEENIYASTEASKRVNLSAENRKNLIAELEAKGILDVEF